MEPPDLPPADLPALLDRAGLEAASRLAWRVAHDLGNVRTVLSGNLERLWDDLRGDAPAASRRLAGLGDGLSRLGALDESLSRFLGRADEAQFRCSPARELSGGRLEALLGGFDPPLAVRPEIDVDPEAAEAPPVRCSAESFRAAVAALLRNADDAQADAAAPRTLLSLSSADLSSGDLAPMLHWGAPPGRYLVVAVEDRGEGIAEAILPHIFTPGFSSRIRRDGLGLSGVYGFVKSLPGRAALGLRTAQGRGTRVSLCLLAAPPH